MRKLLYDAHSRSILECGLLDCHHVLRLSSSRYITGISCEKNSTRDMLLNIFLRSKKTAARVGDLLLSSEFVVGDVLFYAKMHRVDDGIASILNSYCEVVGKQELGEFRFESLGYVAGY